MSLKFSYLRRVMWLFATLSLMVLLGGVASASMPPAGYIIGNQAAAQYQIGSQTFTVTSNLVETKIDQQGALTLTNSQSKAATPGLVVYFPHQVTNTGNGADSYDLTAVANAVGGFTMTNVAIYPDLNANGVPDASTTSITTTPTLQQGETFNLIVAANVPSSATVSSTGSLDITAISRFTPSATVTNTDTVTVVNTAIINASTSFINVPNGTVNPTDTVTVQLRYQNNGAQASGIVQLVDTLPAGLVMVPNSGLWSQDPTNTALHDDGSTNPPGISYQVQGGKVTILIDNVPYNGTGTVTFNVKVPAGTPPGVINNFAQVDYNEAGGTTLPGTPQSTNYASLTVNAVPVVTLTDAGSTTDQDNTVDGTVTQGLSSPVYEGSVVLFDNVIINSGNGVDTFNISVPTNNYPPGTTFTLVKPDGVTPLTDSNNDGEIDTGPIQPGATYHVFVRVQLPSGVSGGGAYDATVVATSITDPNATGQLINTVKTIASASVDLTNTATGAVGSNGWGQGPESTVQTTFTTDPSSTVPFDLYINHTSGVSGSYLLQYSNTPTFTAGTINTMPAGWGVQFVDGATQNVITSAVLDAPTSPVTSTQYYYKAIVTVPAGAVAGDQPIYFRVISNTLGVSDVIYNQVTVNAIHDVTLLPNNVAQLYPGSSHVYSHTLQNLGNVIETAGPIEVINNAVASGWSSIAYLDINNNGVFDSGIDPVFTDISQITGGLLPGVHWNVFVKVQAPAGALAGDNSVTTVTVKPPVDNNMTNNTVTDQATIISGFVTLQKLQAADPTCSTLPTSAVYQSSIITTIKPSQCVIYSITATNNGTSSVSNMVINDETPVYTTLYSAASIGGTSTSMPTINSAGTVGSSSTLQVTWPTLAPGATAVLYYTVQLDH